MPNVEKDVERLDKTIAQRILQKIKWLSENFEAIVPEPLKGKWKGKFKLRVGDYRVVYNANNDAGLIMIHLIGHRRDVYK